MNNREVISREDLDRFEEEYSVKVDLCEFSSSEYVIVSISKDDIKRVAGDFIDSDTSFRTEQDTIYVSPAELLGFIEGDVNSMTGQILTSLPVHIATTRLVKYGVPMALTFLLLTSHMHGFSAMMA